MSHSTPCVHLVDIHGYDVPLIERAEFNPEPDGPESWPQCVEWDAIHYEISDPAERAALEAEALERIIDRHDAPDPWLTLMVSGSLPAPISGGAPLDGDARDFEAWLDQVDDYPPDDQVDDLDLPSRRQVSPIELSMIAGGLAVG